MFLIFELNFNQINSLDFSHSGLDRQILITSIETFSIETGKKEQRVMIFQGNKANLYNKTTEDFFHLCVICQSSPCGCYFFFWVSQSHFISKPSSCYKVPGGTFCVNSPRFLRHSGVSATKAANFLAKSR